MRFVFFCILNRFKRWGVRAYVCHKKVIKEHSFIFYPVKLKLQYVLRFYKIKDASESSWDESLESQQLSTFSF